MTDVELLRRVQDGDAAAWKSLYTRYLLAVWRYAYALAGDHHVAEDAVSESFLALIQGCDRLDPEACHVYGWLCGVVRNKLSDTYRRSSRARKVLDRVGATQTEIDSNTDPRQTMEIQEVRSQVVDVLDLLPDVQRLILEWKYLDTMRVREIAGRLGQSEKAIESTLYRARKEFRRLFEKRPPRESGLRAEDGRLATDSSKVDS